MSLLTVVQDVCAAVGVERPDAVIPGINANRTMAEMLALANEMAQRIAYDIRDWTAMRAIVTLPGDGITRVRPLPADFKRMLLTSNVRKLSAPTLTMRFIPDHDEYMQRRVANHTDARGEWTLVYSTDDNSRGIDVAPILPATDSIFFLYIVKNHVRLNTGGFGDVFLSDNDGFRLDERLLKLGMIWQWKANKGSPYAEDMSTYNDALDRVAGADTPAPIIIGRQTISAAVSQSYPFPIDPNMVPL